MKNTIRAFIVVLGFFAGVPAASATPWAEKSTYLGKTTGKLEYGLKNSVFGWLQMFKEAKQPKYATEWEGFCVGIARSVIYTGSGLVHLATFPIPVDFPDVGSGLYFEPAGPIHDFARKGQSPKAQ